MWFQVASEVKAAIISGIAVVLAALIAAISKYWSSFYRWITGTRKKVSFGDSIKPFSQMYREMSKLVQDDDIPVDRVVIYECTNGGGIPKPGHRIYFSAVHEEHSDPNKTIESKYQNYPTDAQAINALIDVHSHGEKKMVVDDLDPGVIRTIYKSEGIYMTEVYSLVCTETSFYFISIGTLQQGVDFSNSRTRQRIDSSVNNIRNIFKKTHV